MDGSVATDVDADDDPVVDAGAGVDPDVDAGSGVGAGVGAEHADKSITSRAIRAIRR